ncbi:MAG: OB-fold domain-containing protein [Brevundimonas sp.]|nr:OB-fold domain-containing protein [Brevundimonas sp.]
MAGIAAIGAYIPLLRLQRSAVFEANRWFAPGLKGLAKGERAIANWDEDVVTMAVEAARSCLQAAPVATGDLILASTSFPYADRQNAGIVKEALNLGDDTGTLDVGMSQKAGTGALLQAFATATASEKAVLVIGSERRRARPASEDELTNGDAAAALLVGPEDGIARLIGSFSLSVDLVDHFRGENDAYGQGWEARWVRDEGLALTVKAIRSALERAGIQADAVSKLIVGMPGRGVGISIAKAVGVPVASVADDLSLSVGHAGSAHPLLLLAHALEDARAGEVLLVVGFGQGVDVLVLEATDAARRKPVSEALARARTDTNYLKYLTFTGALKLELGKRADFEQKPVLTALYRNRKTVLGLVGSRCTETGAVQFPRSEISVSQGVGRRGTQEDYPLSDKAARIMTFTADSLTYTPDPPNFYGMIEFEGGGRMWSEFTDCDAHTVSVGATMQMMFRIKAADERSGFVKYFWKAVPTAGSN